MSEDPQVLWLTAIATYAGDINDADAAVYMAKYPPELPVTGLGFTGTTEVKDENEYVHIHGPSLWLEFSEHSTKSADEFGNHPHSID